MCHIQAQAIGTRLGIFPIVLLFYHLQLSILFYGILKVLFPPRSRCYDTFDAFDQIDADHVVRYYSSTNCMNSLQDWTETMY